MNECMYACSDIFMNVLSMYVCLQVVHKDLYRPYIYHLILCRKLMHVEKYVCMNE